MDVAFPRYCQEKTEAWASCTGWGGTRVHYRDTNTHLEPNGRSLNTRHSHFPVGPFVNLAVPRWSMLIGRILRGVRKKV